MHLYSIQFNCLVALNPKWRNTVVVFCSLFMLASSATVRAENCVDTAKLLNSLAGTGDRTQDERIASYRRAIQSCPSLADAYYRLSLELIERQEYTEAISLLKSAQSMTYTAKQALALASAEALNGQLGEAETTYLSLLSHDPRNAATLKGLSAIYYQLNRYEEAEDYARRAVQLEPDDAEGYFNLALALTRIGRVKEAITSLTTAVEKRPSFLRALIALSTMHLATGALDLAAQHAEAALKIDPVSVDALLIQGAVLVRQKKFDDALDAVVKADSVQPSLPRVMVNLGIIHSLKGETGSGLELLERAAEEFPANADVQAVLGWLQLKAGDLEAAEASLRRALDLNESNAFAQNNFGVLLEMTDREEMAVRAFERAREIDARIDIAESNLSRLGLN